MWGRRFAYRERLQFRPSIRGVLSVPKPFSESSMEYLTDECSSRRFVALLSYDALLARTNALPISVSGACA